jgi:hypothetical protein
VWAISVITVAGIAIRTQDTYLFLHLMEWGTQDPGYHYVGGDDLLSPMGAIPTTVYVVKHEKLWCGFTTAYASASKLLKGGSLTTSSLLFSILFQPIWRGSIVDADRLTSPTVHRHNFIIQH